MGVGWSLLLSCETRPERGDTTAVQRAAARIPGLLDSMSRELANG